MELTTYDRYVWGGWLLHDDFEQNRIDQFTDELLAADIIVIGEPVMDLRKYRVPVGRWGDRSNRERTRIGIERLRDWYKKKRVDGKRIAYRIRGDIMSFSGHSEDSDYSWYTYGFPSRDWAAKSRCYVDQSTNSIIRNPATFPGNVEDHRVNFGRIQQRLSDLGWTYQRHHDDDNIYGHEDLPWLEMCYNPGFRLESRTWHTGYHLESNLSRDWLRHLVDYIVQGIATLGMDCDLIQMEAGKRSYAEPLEEWYRDHRVERVHNDGRWESRPSKAGGYHHLVGWLWNDDQWCNDMQSADDAVVQQARIDFLAGSSHVSRTTYNRRDWDEFHLQAPLEISQAISRHDCKAATWCDYPRGVSFVTPRSAFPELSQTEAEVYVWDRMCRGVAKSAVVTFPPSSYINYLHVYRNPVQRLLDVVDRHNIDTIGAQPWRDAL